MNILDAPTLARATGSFRWRICALLIFATTLNYIDRQVIGILAPQLQAELGWSDSQYGLIVTSFQVAYALGFLFMGTLFDKIGSRLGYLLSITLWSLATMAHALANTAVGFAIARFALGIGEAGNFPGAIKTTAEWFPRKERSLATGIFLSGSSVGAMIAPLVVPVIAAYYGWHMAFLLPGILGFVWLFFWLTTYRPPAQHPKLTPSELAYIQSDQPPPVQKIRWTQLLKYKQTWAFAIAKFFTDPVFSFFFFFLPKFLHTQHGLPMLKIGVPLMVIYIMSDLGCIAGGWMSSFLLKRGRTVNASRKITMLIAALTVPPVYMATQTDNLWVSVLLIGLALAAHQAWSANLLTLPSDMFPEKAVGSVVGIGSMLGAVGGMFGASTAGFLLEYTGNYGYLFVAAGCAYLVALAFIQLLAPTLKYQET